MTLPYAEVIGDPIAHSKSPLIHRFWLAKLGIPADYRACHVRPGELGDYFAARRADPDWRGCNVTIPHKRSVMPYLDRLDATVTGVGAVNAIVRQDRSVLLGANTDVVGVIAAIGREDLRDRAGLVLGAGGAARAALAAIGRDVRTLARDPMKAALAMEECGVSASIMSFAPGTGAFAGAGLLVNATQLGMTGQAAMPAFVLEEIGAMDADALVFDMVYAPLDTALLRAARAIGRDTADGLAMLIGQAASAFARFFGEPAPRQHDAELRALLTQ